MTKTTSPTVASKAIDAIVGGYHGDPFAVLGPHAVDGGTAVRAMQPQAAEIKLKISSPKKKTIKMKRLRDEGFFEAIVKDTAGPLTYQLETTTYDGQTYTSHDPYRFSSMLSDFDTYLMAEGTHLYIYDKLGAHLVETEGVKGVRFAVWAPNALRVSVVGDFNNWDGRRHPMRFHHHSGVWELFVPGLQEGDLYKYEIKTRYMEYMATKADPVGFAAELRPNTASKVWNMERYQWQDEEWINNRAERQALDQPISVYELHLGSWKRKEENGEWVWLTYAELAEELIPYVKEMGFTHIELMPVAEHPYDGSWGYQVTGYFAPTSRYGTPDEFMAFVDACHQAGIGVIVDWVPAHFPKDAHGLSFFDGTYLYEHADPRLGEHPDWGTLIFNYGRSEVRQFLISNAIFWLDKYHIDGLRVDAVASMIYLDFSREAGQWVPNRYGGRENIEAVDFIRIFNERVHEAYPGTLTIAEESTSWSGVTRATSDHNGLGFDLKWNMGWMHDTLKYIQQDPVHRAYHHGTLTFSMLYAFSEKFQLAFSHDEVVHLKRSMLDKMPGDVWQKFANLRLVYGYQWGHPGKKLIFMGSEFGQWQEWNEARSLDWHLLDSDEHKHAGLKRYVTDLNKIYQHYPALHGEEFSWKGFEWLDFRDYQRSLLAFARIDPASGDLLIVACNFTPIVRHNYRLGVPRPGQYEEILNSDATIYGGGGIINPNPIQSEERSWHDQPQSIELTLPPLGVIYLKIAS